MTTARQIKKLVRPIVGQDAPFEQIKIDLFLKPIRHTINRLSIFRTGEADYFRVIWHFCPSFSRGFTAQWNNMLWPEPHQPWLWSTPGIHETFIAFINEEILPRLKSAQTIDGFVQLLAEPRFTGMGHGLACAPDIEIRVEIALGHLDTALAKCLALDERRAERPNGYWEGVWGETTDRAAPLLEAGDRPALIALLHEWERELIAKLDLGAIYEPTPFPLELGPA